MYLCPNHTLVRYFGNYISTVYINQWNKFVFFIIHGLLVENFFKVTILTILNKTLKENECLWIFCHMIQRPAKECIVMKKIIHTSGLCDVVSYDQSSTKESEVALIRLQRRSSRVWRLLAVCKHATLSTFVTFSTDRGLLHVNAALLWPSFRKHCDVFFLCVAACKWWCA